VPTVEEQAIAAINAAEAMAIQNVQLIKSMKSLFPKQLQPLIGIAPDLAAQQFGIVAEAERRVVKKAARSRKNGEYYAGWDQRRIAEYANKVLKKL
jgi:hypothetical protein